MATVTRDRSMIRMAVFDGKLDESYITDEELFEIQDNLFELVAAKVTLLETWETLQ